MNGKKNADADKGEGSSEGVYPHFSAELMAGDLIPKGHAPWISLTYIPDDDGPRDPNQEGLNDVILPAVFEDEDEEDQVF